VDAGRTSDNETVGAAGGGVGRGKRQLRLFYEGRIRGERDGREIRRAGGESGDA
jgi:hypothetical protein